MAKLYGPVGFAQTVLTSPGVWEEQILERKYCMEHNKVGRRLQSSGDLNDDVNITGEFVIVAEPYVNQHFHAIRYVEFMGAKWKISNVEVQHPRLLLTAGGEWNGEQA